jgi:hypothetical protein
MLAPPFSAVAHVRQLLRPGQVKGVGSVPVVYSESKRAEPEDQEAGPVGAPGQWQCGRRGTPARQATYWPRYRRNPISVYSDIATISEIMS